MKNRSTSPSTSRLDALSRDDRQRPRLKITCCYVPETHDPHGGAPLGIEDAVACLVDPMGEPRDGVTVCGGEPFAQVQELVRLLERLKSLKIHTVVYSGYTLEALANRSEPEVRSALTLMDVLIDGPFVAAHAAGAGEWRGSWNQRVITHPGQVLLSRQSRSPEGCLVDARERSG